MAKEATRRDSNISTDLMKPARKRNLFKLAEVTGVAAASIVRSLVIKRLKEAAADGTIVLEEDGEE